jgi:hypothetical protein
LSEIADQRDKPNRHRDIPYDPTPVGRSSLYPEYFAEYIFREVIIEFDFAFARGIDKPPKFLHMAMLEHAE